MTTAPSEIYTFRSLPLRAQPPARVDREAHIIYGVSAAQAVEALGHDMLLDGRSIAQIVEHGNAARNGVTRRFTHPGLSSTGLGKSLGRMRDVRQEGDKAVADLHIADSAFKTPDGDLGTYVMDLAENDPDVFGMSVVIKANRVWQLSNGSELDAVNERGEGVERPANAVTDKPLARVRQLMAVDAVDEPAANRDGLFAARNLWATNALSQEAFEDIDEYLSGAGVSPQRAFEFALQYFAARGLNLQGWRMADEKQVEVNTAGSLTASAVQGGDAGGVLAELQTQVAAMQAELAAKGQREAELLAALNTASERTSKLEREAVRGRFAMLAADWQGPTDKHVDMLEKLAGLDGEAGELFSFYVQQQTALAEQVKAAGLFNERGSDKPGNFGSATERANTLAAAKVKDGGLSFGQALQQVFGEQPQLYDEYVREVTQKAGG